MYQNKAYWQLRKYIPYKLVDWDGTPLDWDTLPYALFMEQKQIFKKPDGTLMLFSEQTVAITTQSNKKGIRLQEMDYQKH